MGGMTACVGGAIRGVVVLAAGLVVGWVLGGGSWGIDFTEVGLWILVVAILPAVWAHVDSRRLGIVATEWIWAHAAAWAAVGVMLCALLSGRRMTYVVLAAWLAAACVAVPAWSSVRIGTEHREQVRSTQRPLSAGAMTALTAGGIGVYLLPPVAVLAFTGSIAWTGCFLKCQAPQHLAAVGWLTLSGLILVDVILWGVASWRRFPSRLTCIAAIPLVLYAVAAHLLV